MCSAVADRAASRTNGAAMSKVQMCKLHRRQRRLHKVGRGEGSREIADGKQERTGESVPCAHQSDRAAIAALLGWR